MSSTTGFYIDSEALLLAANGLQKSGVELLKTVNNLDFVDEPGNLVPEVYRAAARGKKITTGLAELTSNQGKLLNNSMAAYVAQDKFNDVSSVISFNDIAPGKSGKQRGNMVAENFDNSSQGITAVKVLNTNLDSLQQLATGMNEHVNYLDMHHKIVRQQVGIATDTWCGDAADNFLHKMGQHLAKVSKHIVDTENFSKLVKNQVASLKVYRDNIKNTISAMVETDPSRVEYDYNNDTYIYNHAGQSDFIVAKNNKILTDLQNSLAANLGSFGSVVKDLNEEARKKYFPW